MSAKIGKGVQVMVMGILALVIFLIVGLQLAPTVSYQLSQINSTSMENVTLGSVIVLLAGYGTLFYYLALVGGFIAGIWGVVKYST